ncbi:MAG: Rne/Rng family ribonuclease [Desulfovibrio sp.]|nr:Rne/Rng family ribonuclease [Desulfovibrio sp.]
MSEKENLLESPVEESVSSQEGGAQESSLSQAVRKKSARRPARRSSSRTNADQPKQGAAVADADSTLSAGGVRSEQPASAEHPADVGVDGDQVSSAGEEGDTAPRKSHRGRRGGRGRRRKTPLAAKDDEQQVPAEPASNAEHGNLPADESVSVRNGDMEEAAFETAETESEAGDAVSGPVQGGASPGKNRERAAKAKSAASSSAKGKKSASRGRRKMFFSVLAGEQIEVALAEEGRLLEYYLDMIHQQKMKGNIYKGVIHNIDSNLQAAFVDYGVGKNGFLQIDEVHPEYWLTHHEPAKGKKFPPIQKVLKPGQEVFVQVVKEPTGNKGAFLTTWLSLAGRFLVLTPGQEQIGVSRKVDDEAERSRLREMINGIDPGKGMGVIVRTVSAGTTKTTLKNDLQYLKRLWKDIRKKGTEERAPSLVYKEPGLVERAVRDYLTDDVAEIWVDQEDVAQSVEAMVNLLFPRKKGLVHLYSDTGQPLWDRFGMRGQIDQLYSREVILPSGGRLVFDQTEALMAIDINSGKISGKGNFEAMAFKTNMEAAETIASQLRLRDIGGQVVIDFIEMREKKHVQEVEKTLRQAMKSDRARYDVERMSSFGLLELVRQRTGFSALSIAQEPCPFCGGTGQRRNMEGQALQASLEIRRQMRLSNREVYVYEASRELGLYLLNHKRSMLQEIEREMGRHLEIAIKG